MQLFERAVSDNPSIVTPLGAGNFNPLAAWVAPHIHYGASSVSFAELVEDATGAPLSADALFCHLRDRHVEEPAPAA